MSTATLRISWAMPSRHTFKIKPIRDLLRRYVGDGRGWADPFAGGNSPAEYTNDLHPDTPTRYHLHAADFVGKCPENLNGVLWDPPYSPRQVKECYDSIGMSTPNKDVQSLSYVKDALAPRIRIGGYVICCGWNSQGFGKARGFEKVEVLLVPHGGSHNDTIVTVERKFA